ncbi:MAG TPA: MBL fold metallo-hydrolase [Tepidisphaeraceae bacterium]|jgi:metallo-beta-lactamase family protein|nr:MBL fold metallo-hydrolase [Tepidisphaeraceae bacterium]
MRIHFCGADRTVTGSSHLLEMNGLRVFLDMGIYQGRRDEARRINEYLPADVRTADAIILSHGHLDHCGKLPVATRAGFKGPIYCTPATAEVARIVLNDSAMIQMEDIEYLNRRTRDPHDSPASPLYTPRDIPTVLQLMRHVPYGQKTDLGKGVSFTFFDAGHILGSAYVLLEWTESGRSRSLLFTGDVGRYHTPIIRDPQPIPGPVEYLITESTYGNARHAPMEQVGPQFLDAVKFCVQHKSRLLIPSFAVGRTQTVLWYIQRFIHEKQIPEIPLFVDSPMGVEVSRIHSQFRDNYDKPTLAEIGTSDLFGLSRVTFASSPAESKRINNQAGPCVIIASSPTCEFGRILHHLTQSVEFPDNMVVFCGYIPPQTLGRRLQDGAKRVRIFNRWYDVKCQVRTVHGLSAHADGDELLRFLGPTLGKQTSSWVVHGEVDQSEGFAHRLMAAGIGRAAVPAMETSIIDDPGSATAPTAAVGEVGE